MNLEQEFERQLQTLLQKRYPEAANISADEFLKHIVPLRTRLKNVTTPIVDLDEGHLPFVIVIKSELVATDKAMSLVNRDAKEGITKLFPHEPKDFQIIDSEIIPDGEAYLLVDIDRGKETINLPPNEALKLIRVKDRFPLTIDEGVAIMTQFPEFLIKNNCFSLLASRHSGDQRVPAIWINGEKQPNLGWCWDGNPHTWLGSASGKSRLGLEENKIQK
jgi:hypothetical protein